MSSQCLAHALPRSAARMNDPPVAVVVTGNEEPVPSLVAPPARLRGDQGRKRGRNGY